ncbi:MAG: hypothetical protein U0527_10480 [Candidatus Eisenbacteria bacterium]
MNIGRGDRTSLLDLLNTLNRIHGTKVEPIFEPTRVGDVRDSQASIEAARALLGYSPAVDLEQGLRRTLDWFLDPAQR